MPKFFITSDELNKEISENKICLTGENAKHVSVLRLKAGDEITVCDGSGIDYFCQIDDILKTHVTLTVVKSQPCEAEPEIKITLFQALPKGDKMELIIQKCVELGVYEIVPVQTENTVVKLKDKKSIDSKTARFRKISEAAAKQSERGIIPFVHEPVSFSQALKMMKSLDKAYLAFEREPSESQKKLFGISGKSIGVFVGPEGGFTPSEVSECIKEGVEPVSLGKRILRTETAAFTAIIVLLFVAEAM